MSISALQIDYQDAIKGINAPGTIIAIDEAIYNRIAATVTVRFGFYATPEAFELGYTYHAINVTLPYTGQVAADQATSIFTAAKQVVAIFQDAVEIA